MDGNLLVAGSDGSGCYYYTWDLKNQALSRSHVFPMGKSTADMTHMNVGVGASQELIGGSVINSNTADIIYHVVLKNKGNIDIGNVQLKNKLTDAFGAGNISNVRISFVSNPAGLVLNPLYDGDLFPDMLVPGQTISNYPVSIDSAVIRIQVRATNLLQNTTYYSSAITSGQAGAGLNVLNVTDSSNNGDAGMIDVDQNGVSDDIGEGVPTPFMYNILLPLSQLGFTATVQNEKVQLTWNTSNETNLKSYEVERSLDGINFTAVAGIPAKNATHAAYTATDNTEKITAYRLFYRLRVTANSGNYSYSNTIAVSVANRQALVSTWPNPFTSQVTIQTSSVVKSNAAVNLYDGTGKLVASQQYILQAGNNYISFDNLQSLAKGVYYLEVVNGDKKTQAKIMK